MYIPYRHLVALSAACVAIVAVALAYRIDRVSNELRTLVSHEKPVANNDLRTDTNFYASPSPRPKTTKLAVRQVVSNGPQVSAEAYLVGNVATGKILLEKNGGEVLPVASMSKLITAFVATETIAKDALIPITDAEMNTATDTSHLAVGEQFTLEELLYPMLLNSSNVAAEAIASTTMKRSKFLELMSSYSWEIGMPHTFFADPSGVDPRNISTAEDFFNLAQYLYTSRPDILALTHNVAISVATTTLHNSHIFMSIHPFVGDPEFVGGKTGHTPEARDTMLTIFKINNQTIAVIVLSSADRRADTDTLRTWVKSMLLGH